MNANHEIYRSQEPKAEDVARLDGFVTALKDAGTIGRNLTTEEAAKEIERLRDEGKLRKPTPGAFGRQVKP